MNTIKLETYSGELLYHFITILQDHSKYSFLLGPPIEESSRVISCTQKCVDLRSSIHVAAVKTTKPISSRQSLVLTLQTFLSLIGNGRPASLDVSVISPLQLHTLSEAAQTQPRPRSPSRSPAKAGFQPSQLPCWRQLVDERSSLINVSMEWKS